MTLGQDAQRGACKQATVCVSRQRQVTGLGEQAVIVVAEARAIRAVDAALTEPEVGAKSVLFLPSTISTLPRNSLASMSSPACINNKCHQI